MFLAGNAAHAVAKDDTANGNIIRAHMTFLADDLLEGRETGMRGFDIAALYVAAQFAQYGVLPKGDQGTYRQAVPFKTSRLVQDSAVFEIQRAGGNEVLAYLDEFTMRASHSYDETSITAPLVFVGYGITAPRFNHDDYAGLDVKGKIVVLLSGAPVGFPSEEGAHYGDNWEKNLLAARHGAIGVISLQTPRSEVVRPFSLGRWYAHTLSMDWVTKEGRGANEIPAIQVVAHLSMAAAAKLFTDVDVKLDAIYAAAGADKPLPHVPLNLSARLERNSTRGSTSSSNVVGMVQGSDPKLKNEYVIFSAHLDHLGIRPGMTGDTIMNGAMDNAAGVATLLEMARMISAMPVKPKRSILFLAVTGEEKGLMGSDYFATYPTVPATSMVANVNLDMPVLTYDFSNVIAFGANRSTLKSAAANAAKKLNVALIPDPWPDQSLFTRTDHYNFVRQGVPAIFFLPGIRSFNKNENARAMYDEFLQTHYHKPGDDMNVPINWRAAERFANLNYLLGIEIANDPQRIRWNKGDFFGDLFKR